MIALHHNVVFYLCAALGPITAFSQEPTKSSVLFLDEFKTPDSDINSHLTRQKGSLSPVEYRAITLQNEEQAGMHDTFLIYKNELLSLHERNPLRGPASIGLNTNLANLEMPCKVKWTAASERADWICLKISPSINADWPNLNDGLSLIIFPSGSWGLWNCDRASGAEGAIIAQGNIQGDTLFNVEVEFGKKETSPKINIIINGVKVADQLDYKYSAPDRYLTWQVNSGVDAASGDLDKNYSMKISKIEISK